MKQITKLFLGVIALFVGVGIFASTPVSALQSNSISISPLRQETTINPGFVYSGNILVKNSGDKAQHIDLSAETFNVTGESYDYLFKPNAPEADWVTFDEASFSLAAGEFQSVNYQISVPIDTEPAGYYLALFALNRPDDATSSGISPTERVASLVYVTVSGEATRSGNFLQLRSPLVTFGPSSWSATLQNSGTLHYRSVYSTKISSVLNRQISFHEDSRLILPGTTRLIEDHITPPEILGFYKITLFIGLGDNPAHQEERWFLYLPPLQLLLILLIVASAVLFFKPKKR